MKNIIITGMDSYIGNSIQNWLENQIGQFTVKQLDVRSDAWKKENFTAIDVIIHVAGIVHQRVGYDWRAYKSVNVDLPVEIARKAKKDGVGQFVFMSTMAVYGIEKKLHPNIINNESKLLAQDLYGKSKLIAEIALKELEDNRFVVSVVRPPNVYGKGCKGRYISGFTSIVKTLPVIPLIYNNVKQSMIYVDNLSELIRLIIESRAGGVYTPQDKKSVSAVELMSAIAEGLGRPKKKSKIMGLFIYVMSFLPIVRKVYGGIEYDLNISTAFNFNYVVVPFYEAIRRTVYDD